MDWMSEISMESTFELMKYDSTSPFKKGKVKGENYMGEKDLQTKKIVEFRIFYVIAIKYLHLWKYLTFLDFSF